MKLSMRLSSSGENHAEYSFYTENEVLRATVFEPTEERPLDGIKHWRLEVYEWRDPDIGGEGQLLYAIRYLMEAHSDNWTTMIDKARSTAARLIEECDADDDEFNEGGDQ